MPTTITSAGITFNDATTLTSANGVPSAAKLQTARTINGVAFDGTANITIPSLLTLATAQTASGTAVDFTGIPSWVKRITVMFNGVSLSGSSNSLIQVGDNGGLEITGYQSTNTGFTGSTGTTVSSTSGFLFGGGEEPNNTSGICILTNISTNSWVFSGSGKITPTATCVSGGDKTLSATLDRLRITTANGTDTFDAGTINISYEG
jgi:hypothetical protein